MNDFLKNQDGTFLIQGGDLVVGDATLQHQQDLIRMWKGWNHFAPAYGVGIERYLLDAQTAVGLSRAVRIELERDGQIVDTVRLGKGELIIEARYE